MPVEFQDQDEYLRHLTYIGAKKRYGEITAEISERLDFELSVIKASGYPGYFLIVQDFTTTAREMGVSVGPGRGSAAGSAVAYCVGITNVDPIKYDLLFERFLNPERVSMPDIDIDFDDVGRQKVIDYVIDKYGQNQVAQIITYGTMAARSSLRDVGRVMNVPLSEVDRVAKSFPTHLAANLKKVLAPGDVDAKLKDVMGGDDRDKAYQFRALAENDDEIGQLIRTAGKLEGSVRNTGIHACGVIITPHDITNYVPVTTDKESGMYISQFDNSVAEEAGLLKMDFLGLKTLTIIKDAVRMIAENYPEVGLLDMDEVDLEDEKTYELFQRGDTIGIFQYESGGMQKHMKDLKPTVFGDLIAMNALYRPGPMEYIPDFVARKHGRKPVTYDLAVMEEFLKETYGITVYQEQVMRLSQKIANFTKGEADVLRKAMGKKKKDVLDKMYPTFLEGGKSNGHDVKTLKKIWQDWEAFASYAFNKSHSTCYAFIAYQTAWLKAHYPSEYMSSVLTHNRSDLTKVTFFLRECRRMGIDVLGPDVNESQADFAPNRAGQIRFGLSALKGVGEGPVTAILEARAAGGTYESVFHMLQRTEPGTINKRVLESLAYGGAFDGFGKLHRAQYFAPSEKYDSFLEHLVKFANGYQALQASAANSLFGDTLDEVMPEEPEAPEAKPWILPEKLNHEKEVTGIFVSGHPLDGYRLMMENYITCSLEEIDNHQHRSSGIKLAGMITGARHMVSKNGNGWGIFTLSDFDGTLEFKLFSGDYEKYRHLLLDGKALFLTGGFQKSWRDDSKEFKVTGLELLEGKGSDLTESIELVLPLHKVTPQLVEDLDNLCRKHRGEHRLRVVFIDQHAKLKLSTASKERRVHADDEFVKQLERLDVEYRVKAR